MRQRKSVVAEAGATVRASGGFAVFIHCRHVVRAVFGAPAVGLFNVGAWAPRAERRRRSRGPRAGATPPARWAAAEAGRHRARAPRSDPPPGLT
eukprot:scaffold16963_cov64-Phaeocystis_antarctica.AAC.1